MAILSELYMVVRHGNRWWVSELSDTHYGHFYTVIKELGEFISYFAAKEKCNLMIEHALKNKV